MTDDKTDSKLKSEEIFLRQIFEIFGRHPKPGEPSLESLPPSKRLIENSPLTDEERCAISKADCRFHGIKPAQSDQASYHSGHYLCFVPQPGPDHVSPRGPHKIQLPNANDGRQPDQCRTSDKDGIDEAEAKADN